MSSEEFLKNKKKEYNKRYYEKIKNKLKKLDDIQTEKQENQPIQPIDPNISTQTVYSPSSSSSGGFFFHVKNKILEQVPLLIISMSGVAIKMIFNHLDKKLEKSQTEPVKHMTDSNKFIIQEASF